MVFGTLLEKLATYLVTPEEGRPKLQLSLGTSLINLVNFCKNKVNYEVSLFLIMNYSIIIDWNLFFV